jgi:hypothetical protein
VDYLQGTYQHEAFQRAIPLECGISGSTNFWLWTILWSEMDLTESECRLLVFSAFLVLGADGGHSLNEVLSTATITAILWHDYAKYAHPPKFTRYFQSSFARHLYTITQSINPIGQGPFISINVDDIGRKIFNSQCLQHSKDPKKCYFYYAPDTKNPSAKEIRLRQELEAFFTIGRRHLPMGQYQVFFDQLPSPFDTIRRHVMTRLSQYMITYCEENEK